MFSVISEYFRIVTTVIFLWESLESLRFWQIRQKFIEIEKPFLPFSIFPKYIVYTKTCKTEHRINLTNQYEKSYIGLFFATVKEFTTETQKVSLPTLQPNFDSGGYIH